MFKRVLGILAIIVLVIAVGYTWLTISTSAGCQNNNIKEDKNAPAADLAPYIVETPSRIYYALAVEEAEKTVRLYLYYELVGKDWVLRDGDIVLNRDAYGKIIVRRR